MRFASAPPIDSRDYALSARVLQDLGMTNIKLLSNNPAKKQALKALGTAAVEEIFALFPELRDLGEEFPGARPFAAGHRVRRLAERHQANNRPLVS